LLSVLLYSFSRVGAAVALRVRDYEHQRRRAYLALHEKGGQHRRVPVHSRAAEALDAYLDASGLGATPEAPSTSPAGRSSFTARRSMDEDAVGVTLAELVWSSAAPLPPA
jgi:integrase